MFRKKSGLLRDITIGKVYSAVCDGCHHFDPKLDVEFSLAGVPYGLTSSGFDVGVASFCAHCAKDRLKEYTFHFRPEDRFLGACNICDQSLVCSSRGPIEGRIIHFCRNCLKVRGHEDNTHNFYIERRPTSTADYHVCGDCGVIRAYIENHTYYWSPFTKSRSRNPVNCVPCTTNRYACQHDYRPAFDFSRGKGSYKTITIEEANRADYELRESIPFLKMDPYPIILPQNMVQSRYGYILKSCVNCGSSARFNPPWAT